MARPYFIIDKWTFSVQFAFSISRVSKYHGSTKHEWLILFMAERTQHLSDIKNFQNQKQKKNF